MSDKVKKTNKNFMKPMIIIFIIIVLVAAFLVVFSGVTYNINVERLNNGEAPIYVYYSAFLNDGGTQIYYGLGFHIVKWFSFIENTPFERSDFEGLSDKETVYVTGWDIRAGYDDWTTVTNGPSPEHTIDFNFAFDRM